MPIECTADLADWYSKVSGNFKDEVLTEFVHRNPNFLGVLVAGTAAAQLDTVEAFWVDFHRLASGFGEGSTQGIIEDVFRTLSIVPAERLVGLVPKPWLGRFYQGIQNIRYWKALRDKSCVPVAIAQALQATGQRLLIKLDDVVKAMGRSLPDIKKFGANGQDIRRALEALKAQFEELPPRVASNWSDIVTYAEFTEGVLIVPLKRTLTRGGKVTHTTHGIVVGNTPEGVRIFDQTGVYRSLDDLSRHYKSLNPSEFYFIHPDNRLFVVKNWVLDPSLGSFLTGVGPLGAVMVRVGMILAFNPEVSPAEIDKAFQDFVANRPPESVYPPPVRPPETVSVMGVHTIAGPGIQRKDWLSSIAGQWYGDVLLWPALWDFNKGPDFTNPNKMYVGQRIKIPFINDKPAAELTALRRRGYNWKGESWK